MGIKCDGDNVVVTGTLDEQLLKVVYELGKVNDRLIQLDISDLSYVSSSGIAAIAAFGSRVKEGGGKIKVSISPKAERIFKITEMDHILDIEVKS